LPQGNEAGGSGGAGLRFLVFGFWFLVAFVVGEGMDVFGLKFR
jgi:hypothetical protein